MKNKILLLLVASVLQGMQASDLQKYLERPGIILESSQQERICGAGLIGVWAGHGMYATVRSFGNFVGAHSPVNEHVVYGATLLASAGFAAYAYLKLETGILKEAKEKQQLIKDKNDLALRVEERSNVIRSKNAELECLVAERKSALEQSVQMWAEKLDAEKKQAAAHLVTIEKIRDYDASALTNALVALLDKPSLEGLEGNEAFVAAAQARLNYIREVRAHNDMLRCANENLKKEIKKPMQVRVTVVAPQLTRPSLREASMLFPQREGMRLFYS